MNQKLKPLLLIAIPEMALGGIVYLGFLFKFLHLGPANLILTCGLLSLGGVYMVLGTLLFSNIDPRNLFKNPKGNTYVNLKMIFGFIVGFFMAVITVGYWGLIMRLPWGGLATTVGIGSFGLLTLAGIGISFKYKRFLLAYLRVFISFFMLSTPFLIFWIVFRA